jgi:hypothetical protein
MSPLDTPDNLRNVLDPHHVHVYALVVYLSTDHTKLPFIQRMCSHPPPHPLKKYRTKHSMNRALLRLLFTHHLLKHLGYCFHSRRLGTAKPKRRRTHVSVPVRALYPEAQATRNRRL